MACNGVATITSDEVPHRLRVYVRTRKRYQQNQWLNSAIAFTHYLSQRTEGRHPASVFQTIIGINEAGRSIDHGGLFASGSLRDQFDACSRHAPELAPLFDDSAKVRVMIDDVFLKEREQTLNTIGSVPNGNVTAGVTELKAGTIRSKSSEGGHDIYIPILWIQSSTAANACPFIFKLNKSFTGSPFATSNVSVSR